MGRKRGPDISETPSVDATASPAGTPSPARRRLFACITIATPVLFVVLLEFGLRLFHYGPDISLLTKQDFGGRTYYTMNPDVKARYFSNLAFSPNTSSDLFLLPKPKGTFRIFCLGGSTTVGYPYWFNGSFSSFLRERLHAIFPEKHIEVINMGMTATNSFTTLDMARELVDCQPDLFIVYDGHNEFYGALGAASVESPGRSVWLVRLYLRLVHFKTFLLLRSIYHSLSSFFAGPDTAGNSATMMEKLSRGHYIPYGSELYKAALASFEANLRELKSLCASRGVSLLLGTQVSNVRTQPPFISGGELRDGAETHTAFMKEQQRGIAAEESGRPDSALNIFRSLIGMESLRADVHYEIARCLDTLGLRSQAESEYITARDLDQLRFRASTDFNEAIKRLADDHGTGVVDMVQVFRNNSTDSLVGNELIVEHLHPNSRGSFLMAKAYAGALRTHGLIVDSIEWVARDTLAEDRLWDARPVTPIDEMMAHRSRDILVSGWPFTNHVPIVKSIPQNDTLGQITEKLTRGTWTWRQAHEAAATYYEMRGELHTAEEEVGVIVKMTPMESRGYLQLAQLYVKEGRLTEARSALLASLNVEETIVAYRWLANLAMQAGNPLEAIAYFTKVLSLKLTAADRIDDSFGLALACYRANMIDRCVTRLHEVLTMSPDHAQAKRLLAAIRRSGAGTSSTPSEGPDR